MRETALAADDQLVEAAIFNLYETYKALKKSGEALKLVERLLKIGESKFGPEDVGVARLLDKIAYLEFMRREFDKTEATYKRALAIREKAHGPEPGSLESGR